MTEVGTNVGCEESTVSPRTGLSLTVRINSKSFPRAVQETYSSFHIYYNYYYTTIEYYVCSTDCTVVLLCHLFTDRVAWSVGLSPSEPCKNGWSERDAVFVEDSGGLKEPLIWI